MNSPFTRNNSLNAVREPTHSHSSSGASDPDTITREISALRVRLARAERQALAESRARADSAVQVVLDHQDFHQIIRVMIEEARRPTNHSAEWVL